jgi:phosphotransferase system IIA component
MNAARLTRGHMLIDIGKIVGRGLAIRRKRNQLLYPMALSATAKQLTPHPFQK